MENLMKIREEMAHMEERLKSNTKRIDHLEVRFEKTEQIVGEMDKSLSISMEQIKTIAEDLKQTSINFKEAVMRSSNAQSKDTEALKEKCHELDQKIEKVNSRLEKETVVKDAESWRTSKKQIWSWVLNGVLLLIAGALGISHLF